MEDLYLNKIISYPRTDSDVYSANYDHLTILKKYLTHSQHSNYIQELFKNKRTTPTKGRTDAGDHSPITPLISLESNSPKFKNSLQKQVYELITRHYLALFGENALEHTINLLFTIGGEPFISTFKSLEEEGFYSAAPFLKSKYNNIPKLGDLNTLNQYKGQKIPIKKVENNEGLTQPPPRYNDTSLLSLMEKKGLGTKSTRPAIIEILLLRNYVQRKNRAIFMTELGFLLIESLITIWKSFLDPKFTAYVESKLTDIKNNKLSMEKAVDEVRAVFLQLFDKFQQNKALILKNMDKIIQSGNVLRGRDNKIVGTLQKGKSGSTYGNTSQPQKNQFSTSECPKCKKSKMKLVKVRRKDKKSNFLVCDDENCKTFLSLPKRGNPFLLKTTCNLCGFNAVKISSSKNGRRFDYYLCPVCWSDGLQKHIPDKGFCSKCTQYQIKNGKCVKRTVDQDKDKEKGKGKVIGVSK